MRLIDADALKKAIDKEFEKADLTDYEACSCVCEIYDKCIDNAPTVEVDKDFIDKIRATGNFKNGYQLAKNYYKRQQGECTERKCCECFKRAKETRTLLFCEAVGKCKFEKGGAE